MIYITIFLFLLSIMLEGIIPSLFKDIMPLFIVVMIIISSTFNIENKYLYIIIFLSGIIYDLLYTSTIFLNGFIFIFIYYISKMLIDNNINYIKAIFYYYILSILYIIIMFYFTYFYIPKSIMYILNLYIKSIIINTLYFTFLYTIFIGIKNIISNRNKKHSYF